MTDPISFLTAGANVAKALDPDSRAAEVGVKLWEKMLGPAADAYGQHLKAKVERWSESKDAERVLRLAAAKTPVSTPGTVPLRVAGAVVDAAEMGGSEFIAEYLSGVLASSRTPEGIDDRGVQWTALVARLSSDSLKMHYIVYSILRRAILAEMPDMRELWQHRDIVIRVRDLVGEANFNTDAGDDTRILDALHALLREGLIKELAYGDALGMPQVRPYGFPADEGLLLMQATLPGAQLFIQGHGFGGFVSAITDEKLDFKASVPAAEEVSKVPGSFLYRLPKR